MSERPLHAGRAYLLKHATRMVRARVDADIERWISGRWSSAPAASLG